MATPDPGEARAYQNERRRHRNRIDALLDSITGQAGYLRAFMADGRTAFASDAKNLVADAVHLVERLAALEALNEVSCPAGGESREIGQPEAQCKAAQVMKVERARRAVAAIVAPRQEG